MYHTCVHIIHEVGSICSVSGDQWEAVDTENGKRSLVLDCSIWSSKPIGTSVPAKIWLKTIFLVSPFLAGIAVDPLDRRNGKQAYPTIFSGTRENYSRYKFACIYIWTYIYIYLHLINALHATFVRRKENIRPWPTPPRKMHCPDTVCNVKHSRISRLQRLPPPPPGGCFMWHVFDNQARTRTVVCGACALPLMSSGLKVFDHAGSIGYQNCVAILTR